MRLEAGELQPLADVMKRTGVFVVRTVLALAPTALLLHDAASSPTEQDITNAAPEDLLGFGFVFMWSLLAVPEAVLLVAARIAAHGLWRRRGVNSVLVLFLIASLIDLFAYRKDMARVLGVESVSIWKALFF